MSVVTLAILIVAGFAGGGCWHLVAYMGGGGWLSFTVGWLVAMAIYVLAPLAVP